MVHLHQLRQRLWEAAVWVHPCTALPGASSQPEGEEAVTWKGEWPFREDSSALMRKPAK